MKLIEIKIAELPDFIAGSQWQLLSPKPLTLLRAVSQFQNPRAKPDDTALIIASENNTLLGLVGLLPDFINGQADQPASSNSCWWVNPEKGKHLAVPLFLKAFANCSQRMFMTDCTPHTRNILEKTNWFDFPETEPGIRGFLKFNLQEVIPAKFPATRKLKFLLKFSDSILNFLLIPYHIHMHSRIMKDGPTMEYPDVLKQEMQTFIEIHSQNEFTRRSATDLEWIIQHPWIREKRSDQSGHPIDYPFSHLVEKFEQYFLKVSTSGQTVGLLLISVRDGHMKVPYVYFNDQQAPLILRAIYQQAILQNAVTLTVFSPGLVCLMNSDVHPFIFKKKINQLIAISKQLSGSYLNYPKIQDGDGDVVFT